MRLHRLESAVLVQQRVAVLDAERADDDIDRPTNRDALAPEMAIIPDALNGQAIIEQRYDRVFPRVQFASPELRPWRLEGLPAG